MKIIDERKRQQKQIQKGLLFFYFFPNNFKFCAVKKDYKDIQ